MSSIDPLIFKTSLPLVPYVPRRSLSLKELLHLVYTLSTWLTLVMPRIVVTRHLVPLLTLYRYRHPKMKETGLRLLPDLMYDFVGHCLLRCVRPVFNLTTIIRPRTQAHPGHRSLLPLRQIVPIQTWPRGSDL